jgi:lysine biosynthesis protein LysW
MGLKFKCPDCGGYAKVYDRSLGELAHCTVCGQEVKVPSDPQLVEHIPDQPSQTKGERRLGQARTLGIVCIMGTTDHKFAYGINDLDHILSATQVSCITRRFLRCAANSLGSAYCGSHAPLAVGRLGISGCATGTDSSKPCSDGLGDVSAHIAGSVLLLFGG